jgi:hypothetical protein
MLRDIAVCDPLHHRYLVLPIIPDDLASLVQVPTSSDLDCFLAPPAKDDEVGVSFRVVYLVQCKTKLIVFVFSFSRGAGQWRSVTFDPGYELQLASNRSYLCRCFCWAVMPENKLLMLDTEKMKFSVIDLPLDPCPEEYDMIFVESAKERLGMFTIYNVIDQEHGGSVLHLGYAILEKDGGSATRWLSMAMISLPLTCRRYRIIGVAGGYLLLQGVPKGPLSAPSLVGKEIIYFSVNLETLQLERFCGGTDMIYQENILYADFPPSLSAPTI